MHGKVPTQAQRKVVMREMQSSSTSHAEFVICDCTIEVTYEESRAHLGVETQRQWSDLAIERSTPCLLGLYSLVVLLGHALHPDGQIPVQQAAWYRKTQATERRCPDYRASASVGRIDFLDIAFSPRSLFSAT